jgi:formylglycine-generating enzyme required for sulfatase activity
MQMTVIAQFQVFVDAPDWDHPDGWKDMPEEENVFGAVYKVREFAEQRFKYDNHPRENVSCYQAVTFCRWLSDKLKLEPISKISTRSKMEG